MESRLEARNLSFSFGPKTIIQSINLELFPGDYIAIMGESGIGKSTLLNLIAGLDSPDRGSVALDGIALTTLDDDAFTAIRRERFGFVFQAFHVLPHLTVAHNVGLPLLLRHAPDDARVEAVLAAVGLQGFGTRLPQTLSGGQLQRVAIARALVHDPALVLADEPTAALDTQRAFQVVETFASLIHEQHRTGIMVTHDLRMCKYVDRVLQMRDGKIVREYATSDEINELSLAVH